jgi:phospholipid transport system transporter-binding protein
VAAAQLEQQAPGRYRLTGELSFATVSALLSQSRVLFAAESALQIDLSNVAHADSAGLSLLIEWLRQAKLQGRQLHYLALPAQLVALASISEVDGLLSQSA